MNEFECNAKRVSLESLKKKILCHDYPVEIKSQVDETKAILSKLASQNKLKIVLCGRYSVGKSTLASILSGKDIPIGDGVTTQDATEYQCENWDVVDTPGIRADHPEHDEISLRHMEQANLLIYMCTIQGIGADEKKDFDQLILDKYRDKTMLVMNQLSKEDIENEAQWRADISRVVGGDDVLAELHFSLIDAKRYYCANGNTTLIEKSRFEEFRRNLDSFVREKNLMAVFIPQIDVMRGFLERVRLYADARIERNEYIRRQLKAVDDAILRLGELLNDTETDAINKINEIKGSVLSLVNKDSLNELKDRCDKVEDEINDILRFQSFEKEAQKIIKEMNDEIKDACRKAERLSCEISSGGHEGVSCNISNPDLSFIKSICDKLAKLLGGLTKDGLIKIVHFFGGKFKPWGAVKWLKWLKTAGPILQSATKIAEGVVNHYLDKKLEAFRSQVSSGLKNVKREIRMNFSIARNNSDGLVGQLRQIQSEILRPENERKKINDEKTQLGYWVDDCLSELAAFNSDL